MMAVGYSQRFSELAAQAPDQVALTFLPTAGGEERWTRRHLDQWMNRLAHWLEAGHSVGPGSWVVIGLPNQPLHLVLALAAWRLGATVLPLNSRMPAPEAATVLGLLDPAIIVADWALDHPRLVPSAAAREADRCSAEPLPERIPHPGKAVASGGSTGTPKIILDPAPWAARPGEIVERLGRHVGVRSDQIQLLAGPLYHNAPFSWAHYGLFEHHGLVLMERFDPGRALDAIARYRAEWASLVPTMMLRMLREQRARPRDLASLQGIYHTAAACPPWVKQGWIDLIGAERVFEAYGSTEGIGATVIRGDEWLAHRGSVGKPLGCRIEVRDPEGRLLPAGQIGEIFFQPAGTGPTFQYIGAAVPAPADRFGTVGDLGWLDPDGYLHLADRRTDLIVSGGANVYPAEIEIALSEHPGVRDAAVIGLPDPEWGHRVHAIIEPVAPGPPPAEDELRRWCRERLAPHKIPKSFELVASLPRDDAGKIRRSGLRAERST